MAGGKEEEFVTTFAELTYTGVLVAVFANQLCIPIPSILVLMTAGALSAHGHMRTGIIIALGVLGCLAGDGLWFWAGRRWGSGAMRVICQFASNPRRASKDAHERFRRYGLPLLCVSKFLPGLDALMPPLGGSHGAPVVGFLAVDAVGSFLWSSSYVGLGYVFSSRLELAFRWAQQFGTVFGIAIGLLVGVYAGWHGMALMRMVRALRVRHVSARTLANLLRSDNKVAMLDLANFEVSDSDRLEAIPGAFGVDPDLLRKSRRIFVPEDVRVVLYCSSQNETVSARAAVALKRIGVENVWVLDGGLKAWRDNGFPITQTLESREYLAERYGVYLPQPHTAKSEPARRGGAVPQLPT